MSDMREFLRWTAGEYSRPPFPRTAPRTWLPSRHLPTLPTAVPNDERPWFLYLIECRDGSYYAGITNDVQARYRAHVDGKGARYTRSHPPLRLLGARPYPDRAAASRAEWTIKQLPKGKKLAFLRAAEEDAHAAGEARLIVSME
jgi:putative endonuclease